MSMQLLDGLSAILANSSKLASTTWARPTLSTTWARPGCDSRSTTWAGPLA
jgi:hypothetical protein